MHFFHHAEGTSEKHVVVLCQKGYGEVWPIP